MANGTYEVLFRIYPMETAGTPLWEEVQQITTHGGIYNVLLGAGTANTAYGAFSAILFSAQDRWLELEVNGQVLAPRQRIASVPYALAAQEAGHAAAADIGDGTVTAAKLVDGAGSGLDADLLEGSEASAFATAASVSSLTTTVQDLQNSVQDGDPRYLRKELPADSVQTLYGDVDLRSSTGQSFLHPNATNANGWTCLAAPVFNSPYYYGPDATTPIYVGETNPVIVRGSLRSRILYDNDNSSYYLDPASTSYLNDVRANRIYDRNDTNYYLDPATASQVNDLNVAGSLAVTSSVGSASVHSSIYYDANNVSYYLDPASTSYLNDVRASILYDRDDTRYYLNPSATSNLNVLNVAGALTLNAAPVRSAFAYGYIDRYGTIASGTGNFTCNWNAVQQWYEITITGETYVFNSFATTITPSGGPYLASTSSVGGKLIVILYDLAGSKIQRDFQFVTYKP